MAAKLALTSKPASQSLREMVDEKYGKSAIVDVVPGVSGLRRGEPRLYVAKVVKRDERRVVACQVGRSRDVALERLEQLLAYQIRRGTEEAA